MIKRKKIDLNFWKNKKVLITGHTGFKGSWLSMILKYLGCEIYGYALMPDEAKNIFKGYKLSNIFKKSIIADVRNFEKLYKKIELIKPDIIIHMAAQSLVIDSYVESKFNPTNSPRAFITGEPELPPVVSALDKKLTGTELNSFKIFS